MYCRPGSVVVNSAPVDLIDVAFFLQEYVLTVLPADDDVVLPDTQVQYLFYEHTATQKQDQDTAAIVKQLLDPLRAPSSAFRTLYVVTNGVLGVRAPQFVSYCTACQAAKGSNRRPAGFAEPHILPNEPARE